MAGIYAVTPRIFHVELSQALFKDFQATFLLVFGRIRFFHMFLMQYSVVTEDEAHPWRLEFWRQKMVYENATQVAQLF